MRKTKMTASNGRRRLLISSGVILATVAFAVLNLVGPRVLASASGGLFAFGNLFSPAAPVPAPNQTACVAPPANMVSWFPGDGNAQDILNHTQDLSVNGGVTFPAGKVGQAFNFDSTGSVTYATLNTGGQYTVDFWIRPTHSANDGQRQEVFANNNADGQNFGTITFANRAIEYSQGSVVFRVFSIPDSVPFDTYTHVTLTYDGSVNKLYLNGNLTATSTIHAGETFNNAFMLGHGFNTINGRFAGQLDEVEIFNRALSQTEVRGVFNANTTGKCKAPVDADSDGVVDIRDACPGTPAGTTVNAAGCPLGACLPPPTGMTNWFPGDGNANDIRGSNNGTTNGGVTFPAGKVAQAFQFDGTGDVSYSTINAGSSYTVDFWMRPAHSATDGQRQDLIANTIDGGNSFGVITFASSVIEYYQSFATSANDAKVRSPQIPYDTYTHIALTYNGSVNRLYINGNLVSTSGVHTEVFNNPIRVASWIGGGNARFFGQLDELEIFNRALSQTEVRGIVNADSVGKCTSTRCAPITLNPATLPAVTAGTAYSQTLTASGGASPYTFSVTNGSLPAGLTLNSTSGEISGTPTTVGTANFGVTATASNSCTGSRSYSITVNCPTITVSPVSLPNGIIGTAYSQTVSASGVAGSFTFNVTSGALPAGVTLNSSGQLSGTPTVSGSFNFTITATNSTCTGNRAYTLTINACTATPQGLISSWRAEGNANDSTGSNNGVVQGSVSFVTGQVGQAFSFAGGGYVDVPDSTTLEPANVTAEAWVRHAGSPGYYKYIVSKGARDDYASSYGIYTLDGGLNFYVFDGNLSFYNSPSMGPSVWDGQWHHVVGTFDGARVRLYVDGQQVGNGNPVPPGFTIGYNLPTTDTLNIGSARGGSFYHFIGDIDEVKIYNRALSHNEVQGNFGNCGPLPSPSPTPTPNTLPGNNVTVQSQSGDALATFAQVTDAGNTTFTPISPPSSAGTPPPNYIILGNAPAYAITTIASYTAPVTVCFTVSSINDPAEFARVRILHGENGPLVDRTILAPDSPAPDFATRKVCARVNSLSPFVTALAPAATPTPTPTPPVVQFSTASYNKSESGPSTNITVTRTGDTSGTSTVEFRTGNNSYVPCNTVNGVTTQNCDFIISSGTLTFAPGQTSRSFPLIIIDDLYVEGDETLSFSLSNPAGAVLGSLTSATLTIADNDSVTPTTNPLDEARYFVREHYYDFLGRLPDDGGLDYWTNEITQCGANTACINDRRAGVSNAFFYEQEYQQTASFVFLLYRASFGNDQPFPNPDFFDSNLSAALHAEAKKLPRNLSFARDRVQVVGGSGLAQSQLALANAFVLRPEFTTRYPASLTTASQFVDAVLTTIRTDSGAELITQRDTLIGHFNTGGRGLVMFHLANDYWNGCNRLPGSPPAPCVPVGYGDAVDNRAFIDAEYNRSFVYSQYSGYLRRDGDIGGFLFWLNQVSTAPPRNVPKQRAMVCSFITSTEYQQRFSPIVSHSNAECGP